MDLNGHQMGVELHSFSLQRVEMVLAILTFKKVLIDDYIKKKVLIDDYNEDLCKYKRC